MNKEHLIKDGKFYNPETSTLIAKSSWFTHYETQRRVIYQTAKGVFFEVKEIADIIHKPHRNTGSMNIPHVQYKDGSETGLGAITDSSFSGTLGTMNDNVKIKEVHINKVLSEKDLMGVYEYTAKGNVYAMSHHAKSGYTFFKDYSSLFTVEEA